MLAGALSLVSGGYAAAASLTVGSSRLGAGAASLTQCMSGSAVTFTYDTATSGDIARVVVGNVATACGAGTLEVELTGTGATLPAGFATSGAIGSTAAHCAPSGGTYTCTFDVAAAIAPASVTGDDVSITGP